LSSANKGIERVEALRQSIDNKDKEFSERVKLHFSEINKKERSIEQLSIEKTEELKNVAREVTEKRDEIEKEVNDILNNLKQDNQTFQSNIQADFKEKKEDIEKELTRMNESQEWFQKELNKNYEEKVLGLEYQVKTYKIVAIIAGVTSVASIVIGLLI
jgi:DNA anti-recombination protein RmuC